MNDSPITGCVMEEVEVMRRNRPLQSFYPFAFVDCIYVSLRTGVMGVQWWLPPCHACHDVDLTAARMVLASDQRDGASMLWMIFDELRLAR